ncbi:restriction endonuclease subunit S [Caballeronia sp. LjRoot34]|uniref:hypothetical protein n=1 Tax=Caballeronia sp. LjRoot34 TaxID=3342325 RepID=UPI003ED04818
MSLRNYVDCKDSGSEWLGKVPKNWKVKRLKLCARLVTAKATQSVNPVALENIESWSGKFVVTEADFTGEGVAFEKGDILFGKLRPYLAKAYLADCAGEAVGDFLVLRCSAQLFGRFAQYQVLNRGFIASVNSSTFGSRMPRVGWEFLASMPFLVPHLDEQLAISNFLDRETGKIDALIAEQEKLLTILAEKRQATIAHVVTRGITSDVPLRNSGLGWSEKIPSHWTVIRLGRLFSQVNEPGDGSLPTLSVSIHHGVSDKELTDDETDRKVSRSDEPEKYKRVAVDDLVYNMMRAWQGGFGTVAIPGMVSPAYVVARRKRGDVVTRFIELLLRTPNGVEEMKRYSRGVTDFRLRLYWDEFKNIAVALPPLDEQQWIVHACDRLSQNIENLERDVVLAISLLKERRSALISAAVTGKIDVRDYAAAERSATDFTPIA